MNAGITSSLVIIIGVALSSVPSIALAQNYPPAVTQKVQAAQKLIKTIGMEEYRKVVESPGAALIVDVREPQEYAAGHVPGAINIPRGVLEFQIWTQVGFPASTEMDRPLYLQCQSGNRASLAAQSLEVMSLKTGKSQAIHLYSKPPRCVEEENSFMKHFAARRESIAFIDGEI